MTYEVTLPKEPPTKPKNDGSGGTWTFELRPTFWLGLTLCDSESAPEFTKTCTPDSDANNLVGTNPAAPDYIGKHPGNAFMELQFYGPGYVPQFEGFGCAATRYCAAMTIDSVTENQNTGVFNTDDCDNYILGGQEPVNWAYITKSGVSQAPANPLFTGTFDNPNFSAVNPDYNRDLLMSPGDRIRIHLHDTPAGYRADLLDLKTHQSGSMTASVANGFAHVLYTPGSGACQSAPYAFHAEYAPRIHAGTRGRHTRPTSRSRTRSGTSSTASSWTRTSTARLRAPTTRRWTMTTSAAFRARMPSSCTSTAASGPTTTSTGPRTRTTGQGRIPTRRSTRSCIRSRCSSRARPRRTGTTIR
jgi:hypothetical protein